MRRAATGGAALAAALVVGALLAAFRGGPKRPDAADPVPASSRLIHTFELSRGLAFRSRYQDRQHADSAAVALIGNGVNLHCWRNESVAEFRGDPGAGRPWVGVTNLNDELSSQIVFQFDEALAVPLVAGKWYRARFEYRTANEAEGHAYLRNPKGGAFDSIAEARLSRTERAWKAAELTFRRPADGKIDVCVVNTAVGEGNALAVRGVEVFETAEDGGR